MSRDELSLFSYEILGLVGRSGAGAHDLLRMARRGRILDWAGESQYYAEPKRLAGLGYLEARRERGVTRERTVYTLTEQGPRGARASTRQRRRASRPVKSDALLRLLIADLVGEAPTRASLDALREDVADLLARLEETERERPRAAAPGEVPAASSTASCAGYSTCTGAGRAGRAPSSPPSPPRAVRRRPRRRARRWAIRASEPSSRPVARRMRSRRLHAGAVAVHAVAHEGQDRRRAAPPRRCARCRPAPRRRPRRAGRRRGCPACRWGSSRTGRPPSGCPASRPGRRWAGRMPSMPLHAVGEGAGQVVDVEVAADQRQLDARSAGRCGGCRSPRRPPRGSATAARPGPRGTSAPGRGRSWPRGTARRRSGSSAAQNAERVADLVLPEARLRLVGAQRGGVVQRACGRRRPGGPARRGRARARASPRRCC